MIPSASPLLIDPRERAVPLYTVAQLRRLEDAQAHALAAHTLMARAGHAAAQFLLERIDPARTVWIACGPGNNGGDALVIATELHRAGARVEVCMPAPVKPVDARWALDGARAAGVPIVDVLPDSLDDCGWAIDGLFGIGLGRPLAGPYAALAARLSEHTRRGRRVLALDVPSGLDSDTGNVVHGGEAVQATDTITFIGGKPGLYTARGRDMAGAVWIAPLGLDDALRVPDEWCAAGPGLGAPPSPKAPIAPIAPMAHTASVACLNAPELFAQHFPGRDFASHKGTFGTLAVVGGAPGMCGAPILAARAALYCGAGKVHVALLDANAPPYDPPHPELMLGRAGSLSLDAMTAVSVGPGVGQDAGAAQVLEELFGLAAPLVIDADALNVLARDTALAERLSARGRDAGHAAVLTPHPLEAARLLGIDAKGVQHDRLSAARRLVERFNAVVVLKGVGTVVAAPDGRIAINPTGNAGLATGGTGDVLGGMIGAFAAQGVPAFEAALAGVYLHGLAAEALSNEGDGPAGLTAGELAPRARQWLNRLVYKARRSGEY
jgi:hydroxyethylthiazole kinase-like uncharacterized protein yjeF